MSAKEGVSRRRAMIWIAVIVISAVSVSWIHFSREAARAEALQQRLLSFLQGVLVVTSKFATPVQLSLSDIPGAPGAVCTVYAYDGVEELQKFLGPQLHRLLLESHKMQDGKSSLVFVYGDALTAIDSLQLERPNYFSTTNTRCSRESEIALTVEGRKIELRSVR